MRLIRSLSPCLSTLVALALPTGASAQIVGVSITVAPPVLPVYVQPAIPGPGYIWTPGYWAYGIDGYYWVPGTWVRPPAVGLLWTPGHWGWREGIYVWNAGYWGPRIGYYGGINYGFGYVGTGYQGGYWSGGVFTYNKTVNNFGGVAIANTYNKTVINNTNVTQVSFNGGQGGTAAQPTAQELTAAKDQHTPATAIQTQHQNAASSNKALLASVNNGHPTIAATPNAGSFTGRGVVGANAVTGTGGKAATNNAAIGAGAKPAKPQASIPTGPTAVRNATGPKFGNIGASNVGAANLAPKNVNARTVSAPRQGRPGKPQGPHLPH